MEWLIPLWIIGIAVYFVKTTPEQRQGHLFIAWGLMLLPAVYYLVIGVMSL